MFRLDIGVKTDPIEYRYSFPWLFRLLQEERVRHIQIGTFFEIYQLADDTLRHIRTQAEEFGLEISSVFTAHRELGGFFRGNRDWEMVARRSFERLIEVSGLLGAQSVGSNPGAVMRDEMELKPTGTACYLRHLKELLHHAHRCGVRVVAIEPMCSLAEPPTLPHEIRTMLEELTAYHHLHATDTARPGLCADVSHGYVARAGNVVHDPLELLETGLPWTTELHLRNTDGMFDATFGFTATDRKRGVVDLAAVRDLLRCNAAKLPVSNLICYLEIAGPKLGRDYSDHLVEEHLREALWHIREVFAEEPPAAEPVSSPIRLSSSPVILVAPSVMCADMNYLGDEIQRLEKVGSNWLHFDIMDAHFVPNLPVGLELLKAARRLTHLPFDVHLMVEDNDFFIECIGPLTAQSISVHVESAQQLDRTLQLIRTYGALAGVALCPATPPSALEFVLEQIDFVVVMTVNPGHSGQPLVPAAFSKIAAVRDYLDEHNRADVLIEVDGNVSFKNIPRMVAAGAGVLVGGTSSLFHPHSSRRENMERVQQAIATGLEQRSLQPTVVAGRR